MITGNNQASERKSTRVPDQLQQALVVIDVKAWVAIATLLIVLGGALVWGFFGTMELKQQISGVLIRSGRTINIYAPEEKVLIDLSIARNQKVEKDQVIARVEQPELVDEIMELIAENAPVEKIASARSELLRRTQIVSYESGVVQDIYVHTGDYLAKGAKICTLTQQPEKGKNLSCLFYVPMSQIHSIKKGMQVNIYPDFADKNTYGNMVGVVASISEYPISYNYMLDALGNAELANGFMGAEASYEVEVSLTTSMDTDTGYYWTTSKGPSVEIGNTSLCEASVILKSLRPIDVFFFNK